jgi:hypothetical protein
MCGNIFLFNRERTEVVASERCAMPMRYELRKFCRFFSSDDPLHAISYHEDYVRDVCVEAGFEITGIAWGSWAGDPPPKDQPEPRPYQDVVTVRRLQKGPLAG